MSIRNRRQGRTRTHAVNDCTGATWLVSVVALPTTRVLQLELSSPGWRVEGLQPGGGALEVRPFWANKQEMKPNSVNAYTTLYSTAIE